MKKIAIAALLSFVATTAFAEDKTVTLKYKPIEKGTVFKKVGALRFSSTTTLDVNKRPQQKLSIKSTKDFTTTATILETDKNGVKKVKLVVEKDIETHKSEDFDRKAEGPLNKKTVFVTQDGKRTGVNNKPLNTNEAGHAGVLTQDVIKGYKHFAGLFPKRALKIGETLKFANDPKIAEFLVALPDNKDSTLTLRLVKIEKSRAVFEADLQFAITNGKDEFIFKMKGALNVDVESSLVTSFSLNGSVKMKDDIQTRPGFSSIRKFSGTLSNTITTVVTRPKKRRLVQKPPAPKKEADCAPGRG